jgi:serine/threonine protein kinase
LLSLQNIVKLLGVCTRNEPVYTVMEYMLYGDLKTYLLARRHLVNERNRWGHGVHAAPRFQDLSDLPAGPLKFF